MTASINVRYVVFLGCTAALGGLLFGFDIAIITGAGPFLSKAFSLSDLGLGWAFSSLLFGDVYKRQVVTAEEHQIGALAWRVSSILTESQQLYGLPLITGAVGVKDRFGDSGAPWELVKELEVSAEHIACKAVELMAFKKKRVTDASLSIA